MQVAVHSIHFKASSRLLQFIEKKVTSISKFSVRANRASVFLRLDNNHIKANKIAEVCIQLPGKEVVVRKEASTFEKSVTLAIDSMRRIVKRSKAKNLSKKKR